MCKIGSLMIINLQLSLNFYKVYVTTTRLLVCAKRKAVFGYLISLITFMSLSVLNRAKNTPWGKLAVFKSKYLVPAS